MARSQGHLYYCRMNWMQRIKWEIVGALINAGACGFLVAFAMWFFFAGERVGGVVLGALALPWALFVLMRMNNIRVIRTVIGRRRSPHS